MFDTKEKAYLATLGRGIVLAITNGTMNTALKYPNSTWKPPRSQRDIRVAQHAAVREFKAIRSALRGGELPGLWLRAKGTKAVYFVEYAGGLLIRHHAQNPATYIATGGAATGVIEISVAQMAKIEKGPPLPNLKV